MQTTPEICLNRANRRNRMEEQSAVTLDFLKELHDLHEEWLIKKSPYIPCAPVVVVDANKDADSVFLTVDQTLKQFLQSRYN